MARVKVIHDPDKETLSVWFDDPEKEYVCEETGDEVLLVKDKDGRVIGFEKLNCDFEAVEGADIETLVA